MDRLDAERIAGRPGRVTTGDDDGGGCGWQLFGWTLMLLSALFVVLLVWRIWLTFQATP